MRSRGETDRLVAGCELNIEPRDYSVDEVAPLAWKRERNLEGEVGRGDSVQVECEDRAGVGDQRLHLDSVHKRLGESDLLHRTVIETVHVVPDFKSLAPDQTMS